MDVLRDRIPLSTWCMAMQKSSAHGFKVLGAGAKLGRSHHINYGRGSINHVANTPMTLQSCTRPSRCAHSVMISKFTMASLAANIFAPFFPVDKPLPYILPSNQASTLQRGVALVPLASEIFHSTFLFFC